MLILPASASLVIGQGQITQTEWGYILGLTSLTASMTVNALVTGLIVLRIFKVFRQVTTSDDTSSGITGRKLRSIIFIIVESGMALLAIHLARLVLSFDSLSSFVDNNANQLLVGIHEMLNVIISSIIPHILLMTWT